MNLGEMAEAFDVIVTRQSVGDMLSDIAAMLTGSLGCAVSFARVRSTSRQKRKALYEPCTARARHRRKEGKFRSRDRLIRMALRLFFDMGALADKLVRAIVAVLAPRPAHRRISRPRALPR